MKIKTLIILNLLGALLIGTCFFLLLKNDHQAENQFEAQENTNIYDKSRLDPVNDSPIVYTDLYYDLATNKTYGRNNTGGFQEINITK